MSITFLENPKDHFSSPPAQKLCLLCEINFPIFLNILGHFLNVHLSDFLLLCPRDIGPLVVAQLHGAAGDWTNLLAATRRQTQLNARNARSARNERNERNERKPQGANEPGSLPHMSLY